MRSTTLLVLQLSVYLGCAIKSDIARTSEERSDMYDCHPSIYATRLGIECDMEGDENAFLLTVAVARCRMPEEWAPHWKCDHSSLRGVRKCLQQDVDELVFSTLLEIYYEVFSYCMNKVSGDSIHILSDLANDLKRVTEENKRLQQEQEQLTRETAEHTEETASLLKQTLQAVHQLSGTRLTASRLVKDVSELLTTFTRMGNAIDGSGEQINPGENRYTSSNQRTLESELQKLRHHLVHRATSRSRRRKNGLDEKTLTIIYIWTVVSVLLSLRRSRITDFLFDLGLFAMLFFLSGWLRSIILKLVFRIMFFIVYICVPRDPDD